MQFGRIKRRELITLLGGAAVWPLAARGQPIPVIGLIDGGSAAAYARFVAAFHKGLSETGYVEGLKVMVEYHWLEGRFDHLLDVILRLRFFPLHGECN